MNWRKKGQEEIVGFVAIIVIVSLVVVFFLGISLRNQDNALGESQALSQFIESAQVFTTTCDLGLRERYADVAQLATECHKNSQAMCVNGNLVCQTYNATITKIIDSSWKIGPEMAVKGYVWNISYEKSTGSEEVIVIKNGTCEGQYKEEESLSPDSIGGGTYVTRLRTCF